MPGGQSVDKPGQPFEEQKLQQAELARLKRENARLEDEVAFLKNAAYFAKLPKSTAWIQEVGQRRSGCRPNENDFPVCMMCSLLSVSRSGYYAWKHRPPTVREQSGRLLAAEIKRVFDDEKGRTGAPRIARRLQDEGKSAGRHRVARIMRDNGWRAKAARKYKATTNSKHSLPVAPNLLEQDFMADRPDQKWVSDITTIWTDGGWLYLAVVLELYSRRVIGRAIAERMTATLVCDALVMALWHRKMPTGVIVHSGRGSQYCSTVYHKLLNKHQLICSMS